MKFRATKSAEEEPRTIDFALKLLKILIAFQGWMESKIKQSWKIILRCC